MKNRFWCFVQCFWTCKGSFDYNDEYHPNYGYYDAYLKPESPYKNFDSRHKEKNFYPKRFLKVAFPYHLRLRAKTNKNFIRTKGYYLSIYLNFNSIQKKQIASNIKVPSKKEAIRKSLKFIKEFETSEKPKLLWKEIRHKIPIINSEGQWIISVIIGSVSNALHFPPLNHGDFYALENTNGTWYWEHYSVHTFGHSSSSCTSIPLKIWKAIQDFDPQLDILVKRALNNKLAILYKNSNSSKQR
jgi:hypothetical protein